MSPQLPSCLPVAVAMAPDRTRIALNGFRVAVRPGHFTAFVRDLPDTGELQQLRTAAGDQWALWWNRGMLYELPRDPGATRADAAEKTLDVADHLGFVAFLINSALPGAIPHYKAFRDRPFTFLALKREFVREIQRRLPVPRSSCGSSRSGRAMPWRRRSSSRVTRHSSACSSRSPPVTTSPPTCGRWPKRGWSCRARCRAPRPGARPAPPARPHRPDLR